MSNINLLHHSYASLEEYMQEEFVKNIEELKTEFSNLEDSQMKQLANLKNNAIAMNQIYKQYSVSDKLKAITTVFTKPLDVFIILENWCGSSAVNVPYIVKIVETLPNVKINFVTRDKNLQFMDLYLTNEKRSIPKVIGFHENKTEAFVWGPNSKMQEAYSQKMEKQNLDYNEYIKQMRLWFKTTNAVAIETDFIEIFKTLKN